MHDDDWKNIPGARGVYSASRDGRIKSNKSRWPSMIGRVLAQSRAGAGYMKVTLCISGPHKTRYVHHLVALTWMGRMPDGMQVNHKDGNKANNTAGNLEYVTPSDNGLHAADVLLHHRGESNGFAKLTRGDIVGIRKAVGRQWEIAGRYGVSQSTVSLIRRHMTWKCVK